MREPPCGGFPWGTRQNWTLTRVAAICLPFMVFAYFTKDYWKEDFINILLLLLLIVIWTICFFGFLKPVELLFNDILTNLIFMCISTIAGSMIVLELCKLIKCSCFLALE